MRAIGQLVMKPEVMFALACQAEVRLSGQTTVLCKMKRGEDCNCRTRGEKSSSWPCSPLGTRKCFNPAFKT
jgi:hypothetical protein